MKPLVLPFLLPVLAASVFGQSVTPAAKATPPPFGVRKSPQDPVPGLIARTYLGIEPDAKKFPTHLVAVVPTGSDYLDRVKTLAKDELRGLTKTTNIHYVAIGFIVLENDAEVVFEIPEGHCVVAGKDFGEGTYRKPMKKGKYAVEITRMWGRAQRGFNIATADGAPVLFHTGEMLSRELSRNIKLEGKTYNSKLVGSAS